MGLCLWFRVSVHVLISHGGFLAQGGKKRERSMIAFSIGFWCRDQDAAAAGAVAVCSSATETGHETHPSQQTTARFFPFLPKPPSHPPARTYEEMGLDKVRNQLQTDRPTDRSLLCLLFGARVRPCADGHIFCT